MVFIATETNYVDRSNPSVAAHGIVARFHLTPVQMGLLFSAFAWTYAVFALSAGHVTDRLGSRVALGGSMLVWSLATFAQSLTSSKDGTVALVCHSRLNSHSLLGVAPISRRFYCSKASSKIGPETPDRPMTTMTPRTELVPA